MKFTEHPQYVKDGPRCKPAELKKLRGFQLPTLSDPKTKKPPQFASKHYHPEPLGPIGDFPDKMNSCRFIHGSVPGGQWRCCAHPGFPWCEFHEKIFTAPQHGKPPPQAKQFKASGINRIG